MFKKILLPTDGSPISEKSAKAALEFAAINKASIVVLSVAQCCLISARVSSISLTLFYGRRILFI